MVYKVECRVYCLITYKYLVYFLKDFDTGQDAEFETVEQAKKRINYEYKVDEDYDSGLGFRIVEIN